ncbi:hypothetical protein [Sinorhizobium meliloti]|uniref:hypothetical protein n=1 Tax=Rhizobium meliloti TaxID=382 RepID=UPI0026820310
MVRRFSDVGNAGRRSQSARYAFPIVAPVGSRFPAATSEWGKTGTERFLDLTGRVPRTPTIADIHPILKEMEMLRDGIINLLNTQEEFEYAASNAVQNERHIQNSNTESAMNLNLV